MDAPKGRVTVTARSRPWPPGAGCSTTRLRSTATGIRPRNGLRMAIGTVDRARRRLRRRLLGCGGSSGRGSTGRRRDVGRPGRSPAHRRPDLDRGGDGARHLHRLVDVQPRRAASRRGGGVHVRLRPACRGRAGGRAGRHQRGGRVGRVRTLSRHSRSRIAKRGAGGRRRPVPSAAGRGRARPARGEQVARRVVARLPRAGDVRSRNSTSRSRRCRLRLRSMQPFAIGNSPLPVALPATPAPASPAKPAASGSNC